MSKESKKKEEVIITKKEACHLLKIKLKDLERFERGLKRLGGKTGFTSLELLSLRRGIANFNGVLSEEKEIRG